MKDFHAKHMEFHSKFAESFWPNEYPSDQVATLTFYTRIIKSITFESPALVDSHQALTLTSH